MVRFLVLAADGCYEFSWSPCGLTQGCARLLGVGERRSAPARPGPLARARACFFFFPAPCAPSARGERRETKGTGNRERM